METVSQKCSPDLAGRSSLMVEVLVVEKEV